LGHSLPLPLPWGRGSIGFFASPHADRLIVFVHGFGGKALKTWDGMEALLADPRAQTSDIVFYGYGSLAAPAQNSSSLFREMLTAAVTGASNWRHMVRRGGADADMRDYQDILIVAHSLGAVIVRRALLDLVKTKASWVERCRILLFGPAHMGTRLTALAPMLRSGLSSILNDLFSFGRVKVPVLDDLEEGSAFLARMLSDSQALLQKGMVRPIVAEQVVFGERENVVRTTTFASDPLASVWADEDHCSICRVPQASHTVASHL